MKNNYLRTLALLFSVLSVQFISAQCYTTYYPTVYTGCQGTAYSPFTGVNVTLDTSTTYYDTIPRIGQCDSVIAQQVVVTPIIYTSVYDTICSTQYPYHWNGFTLNGPGIQGDTLPAVSTCDSIVTLHLASRAVSGYDTFALTACILGGGAGYNFYGTNERRSGTYYHIGGPVSSVTCVDSVIVLNLTVFRGGGGPPTAVSACGSSYNFYGTILTANGTYNDTLKNINGCDSAIVSITLTLNAPYYLPPAINGTACNGGSFVFRGISYPGPAGGPRVTYYDTIVVSGGCDTIYTINVRNGFPPAPILITDSFCAGSVYTYRTSTFTTAGRDTVTLPSSNGCDTTVYLTLTYKTAPGYTWVDSFCDGSSYSYRGNTYTDSGWHYFTEPTSAGCDSIIRVYLSYKSAPTINIVDSFCQGTSYSYRGTSYTTAGVHAITIAAPSGCDTVINLNLSYTVPPAAAIAATICQGTWYVYNGVDSFNTRGPHSFTVTHPGVCDSTINLTLTITPAPRLTVRDSFCQGTTYYYENDSFTTAGTHTVLLPASVGCDTILTLILTYRVGPPTPVITQTANVLVVNPLVTNIQWYLNDTAIAGATSQTYITKQSGVYYVITQAAGACQGRSATDTVIEAGITELTGSDMFRIYPNPSKGRFTVETTQNLTNAEITIYDVVGRIVYQKQMSGNKESINMGPDAGGTYYLVIKSREYTGYRHFVITQ